MIGSLAALMSTLPLWATVAVLVGVSPLWVRREKVVAILLIPAAALLLGLLPQVGWSAHVGSLRLVVDPACRGKGVGRELARRGLLTSLDMGLTKTVVEVVADSAHAIGMFQAIGFEPEALLRDHVRDRQGGLRDLVVLSHLVEGTWSGMATAGFEDELSA